MSALPMDQTALAIAYLGCAAVGSHGITILLCSSYETSQHALRGVIEIILFLALFMGGFLFPGILGMAIGRPMMSVGAGLLILLPIAILGGFLAFRHQCRLKPSQADGFYLKKYLQTLMLPTQLLLILTLIVFFIVGILLLAGFPRGFEVTAYHLPIAINMFRDQSLAVWDTAYMHAFPANMSLWTGFWLQTIPERIVSIANLPFAVFLMYALYRLARQIGSDRNAAVLVAIGVISIPVFGFSAIELGSDVAGVACLIAAIVLAISSSRHDGITIFIAGIAAGLAFGFKPLHLVGAGLLGLLILLGLAHIVEPEEKRWGSLDFKRELWFLGGFLLIASPWLLRNWWEFQNPLYPVHLGSFFNALGFVAAPDVSYAERSATQFEWVRTPSEWLVYPWIEWHFINQNFKHSSGLGAFFAVTIPIAWLSWTALIGFALWNKHIKSNEKLLYLIWPSVLTYLIGTGILIMWAVLDDRQPRYAMGGIAVLAVLYGPIISWTEKRWRELGSEILSSATALMLMVLLILFAIRQGAYLRSLEIPSRAEYYEYPKEIDALPKGAVIANLADRPWHYALYGDHLSNHVIPSTRVELQFLRDNQWRLNGDLLASMNITHLFVTGEMISNQNNCWNISEIGALRVNHRNKKSLLNPRILYQINRQCPEDALIIQRL